VPAAESVAAPETLSGLLSIGPHGARPGGPAPRQQAQTVLALQRAAGNAAVNRLLRQAATAQVSAGPDGDAATGGPSRARIVEDDAEPAEGQMRQRDFLTAVTARLSAAAAGPLGSSINQWTDHFAALHPSELEQAIIRYAPEAADAASATELVELIGHRVDEGAADWQQTGSLQRATLQRAVAEPAEVVSSLGPGRPLDAGVSARLGPALGADVSRVEVHDDPASAAVTGSLGAAAITVGNHVAFAAGQYAPGSPLGDALIAHELAHVIQQDGAGAAPSPARGGYAALEGDADTAALSAVDRLYGGPRGARGLRPALRSGLRLQACKPTPVQAPTHTTAAGTDLMAGTHTVTAKEQADIEAIFQPGSTVVTPPPVVGVPPPPPVVHGPPPMTEYKPGEKFEQEMLAYLKGYVGGFAAAFKARKAAGPATFTFAEANDIAHEAQAQVESYFAPWITSASRRPADKYHKGTYDLVTKLGDQSTRSTTDPTKPNRFGWSGYWMSHGQGKAITDKFHCSYSSRDRAVFERVRDLYVNDPANQADIDDAIHSWPGENSDKVYIQPWGTTDPKKKREARWDLFSVLLHEMLHSLQHPNYVAAFEALGGTAMELLKEGMLDVMRRDLWDPSGGKLGTWLTTPAAVGVRTKVEGASLPLDASTIVYHDDYENLPDAQSVVAKVGLDNCRAAFFLGKVDLLGLSADPAKTVTGAPLAGIGSWQASDPDNADIYVTKAGDTLAAIALSCGVDAAAVTAADGSALPAGYTPAAGAKLKVKGIRYVHAVDGDTLATLAAQNGVTPESIAAANDYAAGTAAGTAVPRGTRILIPNRRA
jgi:LysM repeat protein